MQALAASFHRSVGSTACQRLLPCLLHASPSIGPFSSKPSHKLAPPQKHERPQQPCNRASRTCAVVPSSTCLQLFTLCLAMLVCSSYFCHEESPVRFRCSVSCLCTSPFDFSTFCWTCACARFVIVIDRHTLVSFAIFSWITHSFSIAHNLSQVRLLAFSHWLNGSTCRCTTNPMRGFKNASLEFAAC